MSETPTYSDILEAIRAALVDRPGDENSDGAVTTEELADMTGLSKPTIRLRLRVLVKQGVVTTARIRRKNFLDDRSQMVTAYKLVDNGEGPYA